MVKKNSLYVYGGLIAYILGLLSTGLFTYSQGIVFCLVVFILAVILGIFIQLKRIPFVSFFTPFLFVLIMIAGFFYYYWRFPLPTATDISHQLSSSSSASMAKNFEGGFSSAEIAVRGKILSTPRLNQNQKARFVLQVEKLVTIQGDSPSVSGKVYVTSPLLSVKGLYPSSVVTVVGKLYKPSPPLNPGGFDFADYLQREGIFAGLSAKSVTLEKEGNWWHQFLFHLRLRMIQTHVRFLDVPYGNLVSSMVMGSRAVDLDLDLQNSFRLAGLAHTLAASGFHVSLLLGTVLFLTQSLSPRQRLVIGIVTLLLYTTITGFFPSILRSTLMGIGGLIAMINDRSMKSSVILILAGVILLLINPLWIWDIGFQLSFMATWGLIVSLTPIIKRLDFLPPTIANLIAVPIAATIWTFPLVCYHFNHIPLYGILTNIIATPLVTIITLVGIFTAFIGVFIPWLGSAIILLLFPVIWLLIKLVIVTNNLPFSSLAIGNFSVINLFICYLIIGLVSFHKSCQKYWLFLIIFAFTYLSIPLLYQKITLQQLTVMSSRQQPVIVIQNKGHHAVINLNDKNNVRFNLLTFLKSQGINRLELVLVNHDRDNLSALKLLQQYIKIKHILPNSQKLKSIKIIEKTPNFIYFDFLNKTWLIIEKYKNLTLNNINPQIIIADDRLKLAQIKQLNPEVLISNNLNLNQEILDYLTNNNIQLLSLENNAIQWQPERGFIVYSN